MNTLIKINNGLSVWDLFDHHFNGVDPFDISASHWRRNITPRSEDENGYHYYLNLAGFKREDVDADVIDGLVSVKAENKAGSTASYSFLIPEDADISKMSANLEDGLLTINLEKEEKVKPVKLKIG